MRRNNQRALVKIARVGMLVALSFMACRHRRAAEPTPGQPPPEHPFMREVRARAPFDLACAPAEVTILTLSKQSFGVTGCGRRASYACICSYHVWTRCTQAICSLDGLITTPPPSTPAAPEVQPTTAAPGALSVDHGGVHGGVIDGTGAGVTAALD